MRLHRFCWFLLVTLLGIHSLFAFEGNAPVALTNVALTSIVLTEPLELFSSPVTENDWLKEDDFIYNQLFSSIDQTTNQQQPEHVYYSGDFFDTNRWNPKGDEPRMVIRGQSLGVLRQSLGGLNGFSGKVRFDYLTDFGKVSRVGGNLFLNIKNNFGIDTEAYKWTRKSVAAGTEKIQTGDFNLIYSLSQNSRIRIRSGAGVMTIKQENESQPLYGYNFTSSVDVYLQYDLFFTGEIDWGKVDQKKMFHYRLSIGYYLRPVGLFIGYDSYKFDGMEELNGFLIGGDFRF